VTRFLDPAEAVSDLVPTAATVAVGGMHMSAAPMALVRELVRQEVRVGRLLTSPSASLQADLLIAARLVDEIMSPYVGFEHLGLAPSFRAAVEGGDLRVAECDEGSLTHALYAGAGGIPFLACPPGVELTDLPSVNEDFYRTAVDPFTGDERLVVPGIRPDVALVACAVADEDGNVAFDRFPFTDRLMALAAHTLIVQVERIVPAGSLADRPAGTTLPSFVVSAVVEVAGGCHPTGSPGSYPRDEQAIVAYLRAARNPAALAEWLDRAVRSFDEARGASVVAGLEEAT